MKFLELKTINLSYHVPVLAKECVEALIVSEEGIYVDVTFGGGGHSKLILENLGLKGILLAFDQDPDALDQSKLIDDSRFKFIAANFKDLKRYLKLYGIAKVDGVLADLGVSSHQFDEPSRGFSFRYNADLDMRMSQSENAMSAKEFLSQASADELQAVFGFYGEVRNAKTIAKVIVDARKTVALNTTGDLVALLDPFVKGLRNRYFAQVFQALRMAVNREIEVLESFLLQAQEVIKPGGKLVVMSYHSGEDRLVKNVMRSGTLDGSHISDDFGRITRPWKVLTKKPILATEEEIQYNSRARSVRLRIAEKK